MKIDQFFRWEQASRDTIDVKKIYVDVADDLVAGVLLSQIVFWFLPNQEGRTKLRVNKNGFTWLAKGREDWWNECRIKPRQYDTAIKKLIDLEILEKETFKFNGNPTTHIRIIWEKFLTVLNNNLKNTNILENAGFNESVISISHHKDTTTVFPFHEHVESTGFNEFVISDSRDKIPDTTGSNKSVKTNSQIGDSDLSKSVITITEITTENLISSSNSNTRADEIISAQPQESKNRAEDKTSLHVSMSDREIVFSKIIDFHERHGFGFMNSMFLDEINYWIDCGSFDEPEEIILRSLKEALLANKRNWKYVNGILKKWSESGLRTIKQIEIHQAEFIAKKVSWSGDQHRQNQQRYRQDSPAIPLPPMLTPEEIEKYGW